MRKIILLVCIIQTTLFSQTVVSEFPIDIKHKIFTKKKTGKKWIPLATQKYLEQFDSKIYNLSTNEQVLLVNSLNKLFFYLLDQDFNIIQSGIVKKAPKKKLPDHVSKQEDNLSFFFKKKSKMTKKLNSLIKIKYNVTNGKSKLEKIKLIQKKKKLLNVFFFKDELYSFSRTRTTRHLSIDKIEGEQFINLKTIDVNKMAGYELFPLMAEIEIKLFNTNPLEKEYPTIKMGTTIEFKKTVHKTKFYVDKTTCHITFDTKAGTEFFTINMDNSYKTSHQHFDYVKTDYRAKHNSLLANGKLFQIALHKSEIIFTSNDLKNNTKTINYFKEEDNLFRDDNTHYGTHGLFTAEQKERDEKSLERFLKYTSKGRPAISSVLKNNKHHLFIGSHRITVQQSPATGTTIGSVTVSASTTSKDEFDDYAYIIVNDDNSTDTTNDLKSSAIYRLSSKIENKRGKVLNTFYKSKKDCYAGFYTPLEGKYKVVKINN